LRSAPSSAEVAQDASARGIGPDRTRSLAIAAILAAAIGMTGLVLGSDVRGALTSARDGGLTEDLPPFTHSALRSF